MPVIAVVGASGNVGQAALRSLSKMHESDSSLTIRAGACAAAATRSAPTSRNAIQVLNSSWTLEGVANPSHRGGQIPRLVLVLHLFA